MLGDMRGSIYTTARIVRRDLEAARTWRNIWLYIRERIISSVRYVVRIFDTMRRWKVICRKLIGSRFERVERWIVVPTTAWLHTWCNPYIFMKYTCIEVMILWNSLCTVEQNPNAIPKSHEWLWTDIFFLVKPLPNIEEPKVRFYFLPCVDWQNSATSRLFHSWLSGYSQSEPN